MHDSAQQGEVKHLRQESQVRSDSLGQNQSVAHCARHYGQCGVGSPLRKMGCFLGLDGSGVVWECVCVCVFEGLLNLWRYESCSGSLCPQALH